MKCDCENLTEIFLTAIERDIHNWGPPGSPEIQDLKVKLAALAEGCGYKMDSQGRWKQFTKQEAVLQRLGPFLIRKTHDDGDLTLDLGTGSAVVTTEGELFVQTPESIRLSEGR